MNKAPDFSLQDPAAPPRLNGELLFEAPWEARVFGMGIALHEEGFFTWQEFQKQLIAEIQHWEAQAPEGTQYHYYERWLAALQTLLQTKNVCTSAEIETRTQTLRNSPADHQ